MDTDQPSADLDLQCFRKNKSWLSRTHRLSDNLDGAFCLYAAFKIKAIQGSLFI